MKKILYLIIFLPFLCISCSDNNDPSTEEEKKPEVELPFNEPLFMYGNSMEEVRRAETREETAYSRYGGDNENELYYKESKNKLDYTITYSFHNDKLFAASVNFDYESSPDHLSYVVCNSLAEKYGADNNGMYRYDDYSIWNYEGTYFSYLPNSPVEGAPFYTGEPVFNEPLIMYGSSMAEIRKAETREESLTHPIYGGGGGNSLYYVEQKNGLDYVITYVFYEDLLYRISVEPVNKVPIGLYDIVSLSLSNKYQTGRIRIGLRVFHSDNSDINCHFFNPRGFGIVYDPNSHIEGVPWTPPGPI